MQLVALLKVVLLGVAAARKNGRFAIHILEGAGVTQPVVSSGTVARTLWRLAAVSLRSIHAVMSKIIATYIHCNYWTAMFFC